LRLEPRLHRWRLNLRTGAVKEEPLDDALTEFPRMDNRLLGKKSRYSYNPRLARSETLLFEAVVKYDTDTGATKTLEYPRGSYGGETVFAPRVGSRGEDDGYLLTFVADEASGASELYVIDAREMRVASRARIPQRVPTGYHSWWIPASEPA